MCAGCATSAGAPTTSKVTTTFPPTSFKVAVPASPEAFCPAKATVAIFVSATGAGAGVLALRNKSPPIATTNAAANKNIVLSLDDRETEDGRETALRTEVLFALLVVFRRAAITTSI